MTDGRRGLLSDSRLSSSHKGRLRLDESDASLFRELLVERTGLVMEGSRADALLSGVRTAMGKLGCRSHMEYYDLLCKAETESEIWDDLIDEATISETYFFRNSSHIDALRNRILPELIRNRRDTRQLRIWSAGCATGEEPYTLAILLSELIPDLDKWHVCILGTDINKKVLHRARQGQYMRSAFRRTSSDQQDRFFIKKNSAWVIRPRLQKLVTFAYLNLAEPLYPSLLTNTTGLDLILCRNVAIYLPEAVIRNKAERFHQCLMMNGWLLMGASETNMEIYSQFKTLNLEGCTAYQKVPEDQLRRSTVSEQRTSMLPSDQAADLRAKRTSRREVLSARRTMRATVARKPDEATEQTHDAMRGKRFDAAVACMEKREYEDAISLFEGHMKDRAVDAAKCYCRIAVAYANMGRLRDAETACRAAVECDPLMLDAHYTLALVYEEEAEWAAAVEQLKKALYLEPEFLIGHCRLAGNYLQMGRMAEAGRHRAHTIRLATQMAADEVVPFSDGITATHVLAIAQSL